MTVHTTPHALAWLGFELAEIDCGPGEGLRGLIARLEGNDR